MRGQCARPRPAVCFLCTSWCWTGRPDNRKKGARVLGLSVLSGVSGTPSKEPNLNRLWFGSNVSNTLYSLCLTGDFVTQSASSHFPPCVCTRPPREGLVCLSSSPLLCAPRAPLLVPFHAAASLLSLILCNTTQRYGQTVKSHQKLTHQINPLNKQLHSNLLNVH
jgi:hypothetical protein